MSDLPGSLRNTPDLDAWVRINADGTVTFFTGKVEIGQGIQTALAQIGAEELDVALPRVSLQNRDTPQSPNEGYTAGSNSLEASGVALRYAAAEARQILLELAAEELEANLADLEVEDGLISDSATNRHTDYWTLFGGKKFGV